MEDDRGATILGRLGARERKERWRTIVGRPFLVALVRERKGDGGQEWPPYFSSMIRNPPARTSVVTL